MKIMKKRKKRDALRRDKAVKSMLLGLFLILIMITGAQIIQYVRSSYAALSPVESLPKILYSRTEDTSYAAGVMAPIRSEFIDGISLIKRFYTVDNDSESGGNEFDIYCLDRWLVQIRGKKYTKQDQPIEDKGMAYLLSQIYPNNDQFLAGKSEDEKRYISQILIWYYQDRKAGYQDDAADQCDLVNHPTAIQDTCLDPVDEITHYWKNSLLKEEKKKIRESEYWSEMEQILTAAMNYQEDRNYEVSLDPSQVHFSLTEDKQFMESNLISVQTSGSNFLHYVLTTSNDQVTFYKENGEQILSGSEVDPGTKFKIRVPIETIRSAGKLSLNVTVKGTFSSKDAYYYLPESSEVQRALVGVMQLTPLDKEVHLVIDDPMGSLRISKKNSVTNEAVKGAVLLLKDAAGKEVARWTSTTEPYVIDPIQVGTYTLTEISAPDGYILNTQTLTCSVESGEVEEVEMQNEPYGIASILKVDATTRQPLEGATLLLLDQEQHQVDEWTTTKEAHRVSLPKGTYTLKEKKAPDGYQLNQETISVQIEAGQTKQIEMENQELGKIIIRKTDLVTGSEVEGATLVITNQEGREIARWVSTKTPHEIDALPDGEYTLKEEIAPDGYVKNTTAVSFTVAAGKTTPVEMKNEPYGTAQIIKIDATTRQPLEGATLLLLDQEQHQVDEWTTNKEAHKVSLPKGTYTLKEKKAPDGYQLNQETISVQIEAGKTKQIEMENQEQGKASIRKTDLVTGKEVKGATLLIKNSKGEEVERFISTEEAHVFSLPDGEYTLTEILAPIGYVKNVETVSFTITAGKTTPVEMKNEPYGTAQIIKIDATTGKKIEGATLVLLDEDEKEIARFTSTDEPYVIALPKGTYFLQEEKAPDGYVRFSSKIEFQVVAGEKIEVEMKNVPEIPVPNTNATIPIYIYLVGALILILGGGFVYLAFRKPKI